MAFVPIGVIGFAAFVVVLALTLLPPAYAIELFIDGRYLLGLTTLVIWLAWLRFGGRLRCLVFEGFEHGSL